MKRIVLKYYSRKNLGDDLFVKIFSDYFSDCRIYLITNPFYVPKGLGKNVKIHPFSFINTFIGKAVSMLGNNDKIWNFVQHFFDYCYNKIEKNTDAIVEIGGSIFMENNREGRKALDFGKKRKLDFHINSSLQNHGKRFVIGANLGPVYTEQYWEWIKNVLKKYNHVCLRDYSSYYMVKELTHVQYAPDVIFLTEYTKIQEDEKVVISVVNISQYTTNEDIISAYYRLLREVVCYFSNKKDKVVLVSFCEREGDEIAINKLMSEISPNGYISVCNYNSNIDEILNLFANASYVIASRFHSLILSVIFNKPVFPISYNCKTENYLYDLNFEGKYAKLDDLLSMKLEDILFNYKNRIIIDNLEHKKYASNQFWGLKTYLNKK